MKTTTHLPTETIEHHPLLSRMPMMPDEEFDALVADIRERGIDYPIQVVEVDGQVLAVDGRHRLRAAKELEMAEVPVFMREPVHAAGIIIGQIVGRRHYPKGVLAYVVYPLLPAPAKPKDFLKHGSGPSSINRQRESQPTIDDLCRRYGFCRDLYFAARGVHEKFIERPDLRDRYEPELFSGKISLGALNAGLAGQLTTEGKQRADRDPGELLARAIETLHTRFTYWDRLGARDREAAAIAIADCLLQGPPELRKAVAAALRPNGRAL